MVPTYTITQYITIFHQHKYSPIKIKLIRTLLYLDVVHCNAHKNVFIKKLVRWFFYNILPINLQSIL